MSLQEQVSMTSGMKVYLIVSILFLAGAGYHLYITHKILKVQEQILEKLNK